MTMSGVEGVVFLAITKVHVEVNKLIIW